MVYATSVTNIVLFAVTRAVFYPIVSEDTDVSDEYGQVQIIADLQPTMIHLTRSEVI